MITAFNFPCAVLGMLFLRACLNAHSNKFLGTCYQFNITYNLFENLMYSLSFGNLILGMYPKLSLKVWYIYLGVILIVNYLSAIILHCPEFIKLVLYLIQDQVWLSLKHLSPSMHFCVVIYFSLLLIVSYFSCNTNYKNNTGCRLQLCIFFQLNITLNKWMHADVYVQTVFLKYFICSENFLILLL